MTSLYQDYRFTVHEAVGRPVTELIGVVDESAQQDDMCPFQVYARLEDPTEWHIMYLNIRAAFWDMQTFDSGTEELGNLADDDCRLVNYADKVGGLPRRVRNAHAYIDSSDGRTYLKVVFDNNVELTLVPDSDELDMRFAVEFN